MDQMKEYIKKAEINCRMASLLKSEEQKSSTLAQHFRQDGNRLYATCQNIKNPDERKKTYAHVYACYAQSIAYAPTNFQELPLAYGNLSLILLKLEQYSECLQAIDTCLSLGYPDQSKFKIYQRKIECLKTLDEPLKAKRAYVEAKVWIQSNQTEEEQKIKMKKELEDFYKKQVEVKKRFNEEEVDQIWQEFSIKSYNEEIPVASSAISLKYSESQGRHFVATRDIRPGEILLKERPFAVVWSGGSRYNCCWECFQASTNCIPCDCCVNVIFCSVKCKEKAWEKYHQHECKLLPIFVRIPPKTLECVVVAVRILIDAIKEYGTFEKLRKAVNEMDQSSSDPRTAGFTDGQLLSDKYRGFYSLKSDPVSVQTYSSWAANAVYHVATSTKLLGKTCQPSCEHLHEDENVLFAACLILKHILIHSDNGFQGSDPTIYSGTCLSVVGSMFNHSCFPNAFYQPNKSCALAIAIRPIKKGEQIFHNYTESMFADKKERQQMLDTFCFTCKCVACVNDWPLEKLYSQPSGLTNIYSKAALILGKLNPNCLVQGSSVAEIKCQRDKKWMTDVLKQLSDLTEKLFGNISKPCVEYKILLCAYLYMLRELPVAYM